MNRVMRFVRIVAVLCFGAVLAKFTVKTVVRIMALVPVIRLTTIIPGNRDPQPTRNPSPSPSPGCGSRLQPVAGSQPRPTTDPPQPTPQPTRNPSPSPIRQPTRHNRPHNRDPTTDPQQVTGNPSRGSRLWGRLRGRQPVAVADPTTETRNRRRVATDPTTDPTTESRIIPIMSVRPNPGPIQPAQPL
jgi:hypothetical protein